MDIQPYMKLADSSTFPSLSEVPVTACLAVLPKSSVLTVIFCFMEEDAQQKIYRLFMFLCKMHSALVYRWKACRPLCYLTFYKWFIESEILASLYLSAGGWRTQPSLCAHQHCSFTMGSTCCIPSQICLCYEFIFQPHDMVQKKMFFIGLPLYCGYPVISWLVRLSRHVLFVYLHHCVPYHQQ